MIKRLFLFLAVALSTFVSSQAQDEKDASFYALGKRVGIGVGVGTEGIGIDVATHLNNYFGVRVGLNFMPAFKFNTDVDVEEVEGAINGSSYSGSRGYDPVKLEASFARTTFDVKFDVYPLGCSRSSFFITAGLSIGGEKLVKINGHWDDYNEAVTEAGKYGVNIADYEVPLDERGNIEAGLKVNNVRPYLGIGFGRLVPKNRIGIRWELGVQFHGKPKLYASTIENMDEYLRNNLSESDSDDFNKIMDNFKVWPVMKLSIRGRIL